MSVSFAAVAVSNTKPAAVCGPVDKTVSIKH